MSGSAGSANSSTASESGSETVSLPAEEAFEFLGECQRLGRGLARLPEDQRGTSLEALVNRNAEDLLQKLLNDNEGEQAHNYAEFLSKRYHAHGDPDDLALSLEVAQQVVRITPSIAALLDPEHASDSRPALNLKTTEMLNTLAAVLEQVFLLNGDLAALNRAIFLFRTLTEAALPDDCESRRASFLSNYATGLQRRFEQSDGRSRDDLVLAVSASQEAVRLVQEGDPDRGAVLSGAGQPLALLAEITKDVQLMDEALAFFQEAEQIFSDAETQEHIDLGVNKALRTFQKYKILHLQQAEYPAECLRKAIETAKSTLQLAQAHRPSLDNHLPAQSDPTIEGPLPTPGCLHVEDHLHNLLGLFHYHRFFDTGSGSTETATEALDHLRVALASAAYTPVYRRVQAGRMILRLCCELRDWEGAYNAAIDAVDLIPKISSHSLATSDKQRQLGAEDVVGFGADAAAAALNAGKTAYEALSILERGRGSLAASVLDLRVDLAALTSKHPQLAKKFIDLRDQLQMESPQRHEANSLFDRLVEEIRQKAGFERFLQPPNEQELRETARSGPIVVLSASQYRGVDAFLITQRGGVEVLLLQRVSATDLESKSSDLKCLSGLEWLWAAIAEQVLNSLGYTQSPRPTESLSRVWWIPTGILTRFPFHAAGRHTGGSGNAVMDRVMSSYSSSIKALLATRRRTHSISRPRQVLMVAMPETPQHTPLAMPAEEIRMVESLFASSSFNSISLRDRPRRELVLQHLGTSQIFHFAGHGQENVTDPSQSLLLLHDWEDNPMTVESLLGSSFENLFLAYLSACETGQVTNDRFRDEGIHLASAHQLAGFRHVIGTLWSVEDSVCVGVANAVYRVLLDGSKEDFMVTDERVCRALHKAIKEQRDKAMNRANTAHLSSDKNDGAETRKGSKLYDVVAVQAGGTAGTEAGKIMTQAPFGVDLSKTQHWIPYVHYGP